MHSLLCLLRFLLCLLHLQQFNPQTNFKYLFSLFSLFFFSESGIQRESAREEEQSQGAAGPAQELKDAGAPRLRVMSGSNWEKERDRICERHMEQNKQNKTNNMKQNKQEKIKQTKQNKQNKQNKTNKANNL